MKKNKKIALICIIAGSAYANSSIAFANENNNTITDNSTIIEKPYNTEYNTGLEEINPFDLEIGSGSLNSSVGFDRSWTLNANNGRVVNFYIENTGTLAIRATINGGSARTFQPGESGHINATVSNTILGQGGSYKFEAYSASNGGTVRMN